jgi:hypothetical protein
MAIRKNRRTCHDRGLEVSGFEEMHMALKDELLFRLRGPMVNALTICTKDMYDEIDRLQKLCQEAADEIERLQAALKLFTVHATYPVAKEINPRGYAWRGEGALDHAKSVADAALEPPASGGQPPENAKEG